MKKAHLLLKIFLIAAFIVLFAVNTFSQQIAGSKMPDQESANNDNSKEQGQVRIPLNIYTDLINQIQSAKKDAPADYAIGKSQINVYAAKDNLGVNGIAAKENKWTKASVNISFNVKVLEDRWTIIPILPSDVALISVAVNSQPAELINTAYGLSFITKTSGSYSVTLQYNREITQSDDRDILSLPMPKSTGSALNAEIARKIDDIIVSPGIVTDINKGDALTRITAALPPTDTVQISWKTSGVEDYVISRAEYSGELKKDDKALFFTVNYQLQTLKDKSLIIPLLSKNITLREITINEEQAPIILKNDFFSIVINKAGVYNVAAKFTAPIDDSAGPSTAQFPIPIVPVSRFELLLPGNKELTVSPLSQISAAKENDYTRSVTYVPLTESVNFSWNEAVPEEDKERVQSSASLYHLAYAEEGALYLQAAVLYNVTRGKVSSLEFELPNNVQINKIEADVKAIIDWRITDLNENKKLLTIYLNREIKDDFLFNIYYEHLLKKEKQDNETSAAANIVIPLLTMKDIERQRGMIALLQGKELSLKPEVEEEVTKVGENQLPAFVKQKINMTIAHTYKYHSVSPVLAVSTQAPEKKKALMNAQINTLISIGDVTLKGSATVEINIKSGSIMNLLISLPKDVNVLGLSAPSLRTFTAAANNDQQEVNVEFTQEMEGEFRLEINYELILPEEERKISVPTVTVKGSEVEHGLIAVEALAALEIRAIEDKNLSSLDINELPQQLVLKTTNPILLAYRYVHRPFDLVLNITRHKEIEIQQASIEFAYYKTLVTNDGLSVSSAKYRIRNTRKQFLRLELPKNTEVWNILVDGKREKPALAADKNEDKKSVLIKLKNLSSGFDMEILYATKQSPIKGISSYYSQLPKPDMVATNSKWDVFMPEGPTYYDVSANMKITAKNIKRGNYIPLTERQIQDQQSGLNIDIPDSGIFFSFEKLYANQSDEDTWIKIKYMQSWIGSLSFWLSLLGSLLCGITLIILFASKRAKAPLILLALGITFILYAVSVYSLLSKLAILIWVVCLIASVFIWARGSRKPKNGKD
ncbi:hypothetical protein MCHI_001017 [Candidatus Magnetoovum chiemensis]|nr:hypothetical protein MCHI_001017 [Candidatus Magnetoovum chiemensis]